MVVTNAVHFVGVALALWLGFFNLTRSPQRSLARAGAFALWAAGGLFLSALLNGSPLTGLDSSAWLSPLRWPAFFAPALWLHLSAGLPTPREAPQRGLLLRLMYALAVLLAAVDLLAPPLFLPLDPPPAFAPAFVFLYAMYLLACVVFSAANLRSAYSAVATGSPLRPALDWLVRGYLLAGLGGLLFAVAQAGPLAPVALVIGVGLTGYALARITALLDGRSVQADFVYTLLAIALVCAAYLSATLITYIVYGIPFVTFIFILMLAVTSHSLYDWTRSRLDRLFFHGPTRELRANLRTLAHEAAGDDDQHKNLHALLATLCRSLGVARGAVLLRAGEQYTLAAAVGGLPAAQPLPAALFDTAELTRRHAPTPLGVMAMLAPLCPVDRQEGALLLGPREHGQAYSADDEALVVEVADRMEYLLARRRLREDRTRRLNEQLAQFRASERQSQVLAAQVVPLAAPGLSEQELVSGVEDALRHLADVPYLGALALCRLRIVLGRLEPGAQTNLDRGRALKAVLVEALDKLRPAGSEPNTPGSEWYAFLILREAYLVGVPNQEIMTRFYISEGTFNRTRRRAIRAIALAISEMEASQ